MRYIAGKKWVDLKSWTHVLLEQSWLASIQSEVANVKSKSNKLVSNPVWPVSNQLTIHHPAEKQQKICNNCIVHSHCDKAYYNYTYVLWHTCTLVCTHMHVHTHTHMHTCTHTYAHSYRHFSAHTYTLPYAGTHSHPVKPMHLMSTAHICIDIMGSKCLLTALLYLAASN